MNKQQKRRLYESVMKSVSKSLIESANYTYKDINTILEDEFPLSITTYAGTQEDTYTVTVSEYEEDDNNLYFHAETNVGFAVDFEIEVDDFLNEYDNNKPAEEIVEWYLVNAVDNEVDSQYGHGEYDPDDEYFDDDLEEGWVYVDDDDDDLDDEEEEPKYTLVGCNGNAHAIMGYVENAMKKEGKSQSEIRAYRTDAMSSSYNNLLLVSIEILDELNKM